MFSNQQNDKFDRTRLLTYFLVSAAFLYFVFSPAINILYYAGDSFRYAFGGFDKRCGTDDGFYFMMTLGRPLQAYLDCVSYKFAYTMERMAILRMVSVGLLALAVALFSDWLYQLKFSFWAALFIAGGIIIMPRLYGDSVITAATSLPVSIVFTLMAYRFVNTAHAYNEKLQSQHAIKYYLAAGAFILMALVSYPATTFFFGTLVLTKVLFRNMVKWESTRREVIIEILLFGVVCVIYFIGAFINMRYNAQAPIPTQYHIDHPNFSVAELLGRLMMLGNMFTIIWQVLPVGSYELQGWIMSGILAAGFISAIILLVIKRSKTQNSEEIWQAVGLACVLVMLCSSFFLIIPTRDVGARLLFGPISAGLVIMVWCLSRVLDLVIPTFSAAVLTVVLGLFMMTDAYYANVYSLTTALSIEKRANYLKAIVAEYLGKGQDLKRIHLVLRQPDYAYNRFFQANAVLVDLLGHGNYTLEWCSLARGIEGAEKDHQPEMKKCLAALPRNGIGVTYSYKDEPYTKTKGTLVIVNDNDQF